MHVRLRRFIGVSSFLLGLIVSPLVFGSLRAQAEPASVVPCTAPQTVSPEIATTDAPSPETPEPATASELTRSPARFNEAFPDPSGDDSTQEFIEIENPDGREQDLAGWRIENADGRSFVLGVKVGPNAQYAFLHAETKLSLVNSGMTLMLRDPSGAIVDTLTYPGPAMTGKVYARTTDGSWKWSSTPTPGRTNEFDAETAAPSAPTPVDQSAPMTETQILTAPATPGVPANDAPDDGSAPHVSIVAFLPDPIGDDGAEWVALANGGSKNASLDGWSLDDGDGGSKPYLLAGLSIPAEGRIVVSRVASKIILNNDADEVRLFEPNGAVRQTVSYAHPPEGKTYEFLDGAWGWMPPNAVSAPILESRRSPTTTDMPPSVGDDGTPATDAAAPEESVATDIADLESFDEDVLAEISGMITVPPGIVGKRTFAVQSHDGASGIFVRAYGPSPLPSLKAGDRVRVTGRAVRVNGAPMLSTLGRRIARVDAGTMKFHARAVDEIGRGDVGVAIDTEGIVTHRGKSAFIIADDAMHRELSVRAHKGGTITGVTVGATVKARGVVRYRDGTPELITLGADAIAVAAPPRAEEKNPMTHTVEPLAPPKTAPERAPLVFGTAAEKTISWLAVGSLAASALAAAVVLFMRRRNAAEMDSLASDR